MGAWKARSTERVRPARVQAAGGSAQASRTGAGMFDSDSDEDDAKRNGRTSATNSVKQPETNAKMSLTAETTRMTTSRTETTAKPERQSTGGLFGDESEPDSEPPVKAAVSQQQQRKPAPVQSSSGGLFGDSDDDEDDGPLMAAAVSAPKAAHTTHSSGLFGATVSQQQQQKPAPVQSSSGGLFGDSDDDEDDGPLMAAAASAPKAAAAPKAAPAPTAKRPVGGLFGDDSDSESDATGLFGGSSKPGSGSSATIAPAGLFANDAPSDDDGGLFGSAPQHVEEATAVNAEEEAQASGQWDQSSVGRLIDMGFARVDVEAALAVKGGDVQQAADWLLVGGTAAAVERTSHSDSSSDVAAVSSANGGGLDQSSAFHGTYR